MSLRNAVVVGILAPCAWLAGFGALAVTGAHAAEVCFPAAKWAPAPDAVRPCLTVRHIRPDAVAYVGRDASGTIRYSGTVSPVPHGAPHIRLYEDGSARVNIGGFRFTIGDIGEVSISR